MFPRQPRPDGTRPPSHDPQSFVVVPTGSSPAIVATSIQTSASNAASVLQAQQAVAAAQAQDAAMTPQQLQRLKVEDALSYLDKVKIKYLYQPDIYNQFLDIMKEFKSQSIDTPGVIRRVSTLFQKDPDLIIGFNTFLPPGFRMEVRGETVVIKQPTGTTVLSGEELSAARSQLMTGVSQTASASPPVFIVQQPPPAAAPATSQLSVVPTQPQSANPTLPGAVDPAVAAQQAQINVPVEFNYAINYVNKIKLRFQDKPDVYKQFLEILHRYQKEQKMLREGGIPPGSRFLTEAEVYSEVSRLFTNQKDILDEFGHFLPETTAASGANFLQIQGAASAVGGEMTPPFGSFPSLQQAAVSAVAEQKPLPTEKEKLDQNRKKPNKANGSSSVRQEDEVPLKKVPKKVTPIGGKIGPSGLQSDLAEAAKYGKLEEIAFFDKLRKVVKSRQVYENFLRCLGVYADEVASKSDLLQMVLPFLKPHPELLRQFKEIMGLIPASGQRDLAISSSVPLYSPGGRWGQEPQVEVDYSTLKMIDESESYRVLPANYPQPKCSGRTALCYEVLNDRYVSFPAWSESSYFVSAKKTQYEETIYRCEDERFELEMVIEVNRSAILCLEAVQRKLHKMSSEDAANYRLDNTLGGSSEVIQQKAIQRLYGDRAPEIIEGLKRNPVVAVPIVLRRLKAKDEEWRDAQRSFNKIWREQMRKFYLKSLDHQGITFKQNDMRALRSKALINEIEETFEAQQKEERKAVQEPHMILQFDDASIIDDATELIVHHAKRQTGLTKDYKRMIKQLLYHFLPDLFHMKRHDFSDSEDETDSENDSASDDDEKTRQVKISNRQARAQARSQRLESKKSNNSETAKSGAEQSASQPMELDGEKSNHSAEEGKSEAEAMETEKPVDTAPVAESSYENKLSEAMETSSAQNEPIPPSKVEPKTEAPSPNEPLIAPPSNGGSSSHSHPVDAPHLLPSGIDTMSSLFFAGNHWYLFFRLHNLLCSRLQILQNAAQKCVELAAANAPEAQVADSKTSAATKLKYKSPPEYEPHQYYQVLLDLVRQLLDCSIDANQYEEQLRQMFGIHAYWGFTLDKIVQHLVKQLQHLVTDDSYQGTMSIFHEMVREGVAYGRIIDSAHRQMSEIGYERKVCKLIPNDNVFRFAASTAQPGSVQLGIEMIASEANGQADASSAVMNWSSYVRYYAAPELRLRMGFRRPRFLLRGWRKRAMPDPDASRSQTPDAVCESGSTWGQMGASELADGDPKRDQLLLWDNEHAIICPKTLRIRYTRDHRMVFFRRGRSIGHTEKQKQVTSAQNDRLTRFIIDWEEKNLTPMQRADTMQWFIERNVEPVAAGSDNAPPYHRYNRYHLTK